MVDVFMDERLPDYFSEVGVAEVGTQALRGFLSEKIVCVKGLDIGDPDFDLLSRVSFPQMWEMKKFRFDALLAEGEGPRFVSIRDSVFGGDGSTARQFVRELHKLSAAVDSIIGAVLCGFNYIDVVKIARFSETRMENLHYDLDSGSDDHEAFRLYINIDSAPRIWNTSYQMSSLASRLAGQMDLSRFNDLPAEVLLKEITTRAYGGWNERATDRGAPRHIVYFDPGDVWIVDGRSVAHQVTYGHRVISVYVKLPHATNPDLAPTFNQKLRAAVAQPLVGLPVPVYGPGQVGAAGDVKGTWNTVFGEIGTGGVRRFGRQGLTTPPT